MKQLLSVVLTGLTLISALPAAISWFSAINPREPAVGWSIRIVSTVIFTTSVAGLIYLATRPESVPDFLAKRPTKRLGRGAVLFVFESAARDGWTWIDIHYQNRFSKASQVSVVMLPSQNFLMQRNDIDPVVVTFPCGPAAYGIVRVPLAVQRQYQGQSQPFDVASKTDYPQGLGDCLRNVVGERISEIGDSLQLSVARAVVLLAVSQGRLGGVKFQSRINLPLPASVSETTADTPGVSQEELWSLDNPSAAPAKQWRNL